MKIEFGKAFDNKTWRFLIPTIRGHGEDFVNRFNIMIRKLAYGIYDKALEGAQILDDRRPIFILCDKNSVQFEDFLIYIRNQYFFITDYQSDTTDSFRVSLGTDYTGQLIGRIPIKFDVWTLLDYFNDEVIFDVSVVKRKSLTYNILFIRQLSENLEHNYLIQSLKN